MVRQQRKMYSNFVGVTYSKTHAKYQVCINHDRRQHNLGRYRLASDAALAYDESVRLLKGQGWKVNFHTRKEYEVARDKELRALLSVTTTMTKSMGTVVGGGGGRKKGADEIEEERKEVELAIANKVGEIARMVAAGGVCGEGGTGNNNAMMARIVIVTPSSD